MFLGFFGCDVRAYDGIDEFGRDRLINYVIEQEAKIRTLRAKIEVCRSEEQKALYKTEIDEVIAKTVMSIAEKVKQGASVTLQDKFGNSVLNYAHTPAIYEELRNQGAPFQLCVYAPEITVVALVALYFMLNYLDTISYISQIDELQIQNNDLRNQLESNKSK